MRRVGGGAGPEGEAAGVRVPDRAGNWCGQLGAVLPGPPEECEPGSFPVNLLPDAWDLPLGSSAAGPGCGLRAPRALQSALLLMGPSATGSQGRCVREKA